MKNSPSHILLKNATLEVGMAGDPFRAGFYYKCVCFTHGQQKCDKKSQKFRKLPTETVYKLKTKDL